MGVAYIHVGRRCGLRTCGKEVWLTYMWEGDFLADVSVVLVPFEHLGLVGGKVGTHETEGRGVQQEADSHTPFIAGLTRHTSLHCTDSNIPRNNGVM